MLTPSPAPWTVRGTTFALWALVGLSAVHWGLKLGGRGDAVDVPAPPPRPVAAVDPTALARLLGSASNAVAAPVATAPALASRFQLVGVVAGVSSGGGAALISVDGKPARTYRVGSAIEEGVVLQSVHGRQAVLAHGGTQLTLELPRPLQPALPGRPPLLGQTPIAAPR